MKLVRWLGDSLDIVSAFGDEARLEVGHQLWRVQCGEDPADWKPVPSVGLGVRELRVHVDGEHRVFYLAKFAEAVYVLHAFAKKTQKTTKQDIEVGRARFRKLIAERKS